MTRQLPLWDEPIVTALPPLGSTFQETAEGTNPCLFLGKVGSNYRPGMNPGELFYYHVTKAWRECERIAMTCKVIGYLGNGHAPDEGSEEDDDDC